MNLGQVYQIKNLATEANIYNSTEVKFPISISSDVITHTYDSEGMSDADELQIIVDLELFVHDTHLKVLGYYESIGHGSTNTELTVERAAGNKTGITTGAFTILESEDFIQPAGDTQMYLQSASADDAAAGTGAQEITIEYFSLAWGARKTVKVVPNGITQVTLSVADIYRIHKMSVNKGSTAGDDITLTNEAENVLYGQIHQYETTMERCIFYVATGEKTTCTEFGATSVTSGGVEIRLAVSEEDAEGNIVTRVRVPVEVVSGGQYIGMHISETVSNPNGYRKALLLVVRAYSVTNQKGTGFMKGFNEQL